jgi:septal ring factor EnvC (AmiA/AmiB activator)
VHRLLTSARPLRAVAATILGAAVLMGALPALAGDSLSDARAQRDQVRAQRSEIAQQLDALQASEAEVTAALQGLSANVRDQEALVDDARRRADEAHHELEVAQAEEARAERQLVELEGSLRELAVRAYVQPPSEDDLIALASDSADQAMVRQALLDVRAGQYTDLLDRMEAAREDLERQRQRAEAAAAEAEERQAAVEGQLAELQTARDEQAQLVASVQQRIDHNLAEAAALASLDRNLSDQIARREAEIAAQVRQAQAAEAARQRAEAQRQADAQAAAQRQAAAEAASPAPAASPTTAAPAAPAAPATTSPPAPATTAPPAPTTTAPPAPPPPPPAPEPDPPTFVSPGLSNVRGIIVASSIAGQLSAMLAAADADGISLSGGGYRDPAQQIALRRAHCGSSYYAIYQMPASQCSPPTAIPGTSMHEQGLAIDFTYGGSVISSHSSPAFQWLAAHASTYGFFNLPSEPWHWSVNGN